MPHTEVACPVCASGDPIPARSEVRPTPVYDVRCHAQPLVDQLAEDLPRDLWLAANQATAVLEPAPDLSPYVVARSSNAYDCPRNSSATRGGVTRPSSGQTPSSESSAFS